MVNIKRCSGMSALQIIGIVIGVAVLGFIIWSMTLPGSGGGVKLANEMDAYALEYIEEHELLSDSEELVAYYDATITLNGSEAAILTTERVLYHKNDRTTSIAIEDIADIQHRQESMLGDIIEIKSKTGIPFKIEIAPFNLGESFYKALMDVWQASGAGNEV
ncbi:MAG: hypothetical protein JW869_03780 [Candidatus Omnitrophica bacterium]|nr:hypothetical protein [Candidatus Omnitrophota bacterium]